MPEKISSLPWSTSQKWLLRFGVIFFTLFIICNPNGALPFSDDLYPIYIKPVYLIMTWISTHVLHIVHFAIVYPNGSGDTTYDWLVLSFVTLTALFGATIWSLINRKPIAYDRLYYWLLVTLRYYIAFNMLMYGSAKVVKVQFPYPGPDRMIHTYGDSSPMGLLWTFLGYSKPYNYFTGVAELLCGFLLFFRRTTLLGALIALTVIANIVALNYCFDVSVKILSSMLLLMVICILFKDANRLFVFFLTDGWAWPSKPSPKPRGQSWKKISLTIFKYFLIVYTTVLTAIGTWQGDKQYGDGAKMPVLYGVFDVHTFVLEHDTLPPLTTDTLRWHRVAFTSRSLLKVYDMNDRITRYLLSNDTVKKRLTLTASSDTLRKYILSYKLFKDSTLTLYGKGPQGNMSADFKRFDEHQFLLTKRGIHLINDLPFSK